MNLVGLHNHNERIIEPRKDIYQLTDKKFRQFYRFDKVVFRQICDLLRPDLERRTVRNKALSPEIQLATAIRYYATGEFQLDVGNGVHISQSSAFRSIECVGRSLCSKFNDFIKWPTNNIQQAAIKHGFFTIAQFPNVIGLVDGTHIRIVRPSIDEQQYVNRKLYHSLNVQVICDHRGLLTNMEVNWPGSSHDSFILRQSEVWQHMETSPFHGFILGDSGYPLRNWLMTPFSTPATHGERSYNYSQKRTRVLIENTIGRLKRRFHLLHAENRRQIPRVVRDIRACGVLHNIAILSNQPDIDDAIPIDDQPANNPIVNDIQIGNYKRRHLVDNVFINYIRQ